ncbi:unannotated protein [freshwater metagenome]|uniref:Unannotated protein n=1 Tax=freshwater metagenome TaxID=449393 RepID=A0A6J6UFZ1_9ZZZZ
MQGCLDLGRVVRVVVKNPDAGDLPLEVESAACPAEAREPFCHSGSRLAEPYCRDECGKGVERIVPTRHLQFDSRKARLRSIDAERPAPTSPFKVCHAVVRRLLASVRAHIDSHVSRALGESNRASIISAGDEKSSPAPDPGGEFEERGLDRLECAPVVQVIGLDVRDDPREWRVVQECAITLISFHHEDLPAAEVGVRSGFSELAADRKGGIHAAVLECNRHHRRRGRLAVSAGHCDGHIAVHDHRESIGSAQFFEPKGGTCHPLDVRLGNRR